MSRNRLHLNGAPIGEVDDDKLPELYVDLAGGTYDNKHLRLCQQISAQYEAQGWVSVNTKRGAYLLRKIPEPDPCSYCKGEGEVTVWAWMGHPQTGYESDYQDTCPECYGTGHHTETDNVTRN